MTDFLFGGMVQANTPINITSALVAANVSVTGTGLPTVGIFSPSTNQLGFATNSVQQMVIDTNGNMGLSTASPGVKLDVSGAGTMGRFTSSTTDSSIAFANSNGGTSTYIGNGGTNAFYVSTNGAERMRIDSSGNVGIGISSPAAKLDVRTAAGTAVTQYLYTGSSAAAATLQFAQVGTVGWNTGITASSGNFQIGIDGGGLGYNINRNGVAIDYHSWLTAGAERMRIDSSGNMGIGTSSPSTLLTVNGTATITTLNLTNALTLNGATSGQITISPPSAAGTNTLTLPAATGTVALTANPTFTGTVTATTITSPAATNLTIQSAGTTAMTIDTSQNVGIGTTDYGRFNRGLSIYAAGGVYSGIQLTNSTTGSVSTAGTLIYTAGNDFLINNQQSGLITFSTANTERMRIDQNGNVGIGISSPSTYGKLAVSGNMYAGDTTSTADGTITIGSNGAGSVAITRTGTGATNSAMTFSTTYATLQERMRIDSLGNVGIGTSTPGVKVDVAGSVRATQSVTIGNGGGTYQAGSIYSDANWGMLFRAAQTTPTIAQFRWSSSSDAEYMRIDASGNMLVGKTAPTYTVSGVSLSSGTNQFAWSANSGSTVISVATPVSQYLIAFYRTDTGALMGGIANGASNTVSYNTSSDHRLKEKVTPMTVGLATISALKPVTYDWVGTNENGEGFIAHELQEVIPLAVTGEKDAVNEDGTIKPQGVDYSKIVVHLVAACQEQQKLIVDLQERLAKAGL